MSLLTLLQNRGASPPEPPDPTPVPPEIGGLGGSSVSFSSGYIEIEKRKNVRVYGVTPKVKRPHATLLKKRKAPSTYKGIRNYQEAHPEFHELWSADRLYKGLEHLTGNELVSRIAYLAANVTGIPSVKMKLPENTEYNELFNALLMEAAARAAKAKAVRKADEDMLVLLLTSH